MLHDKSSVGFAFSFEKMKEMSNRKEYRAESEVIQASYNRHWEPFK